VHSPPAKQMQKRTDNHPTPQKIAESCVVSEQRTSKSTSPVMPTVSLTELQKSEWREGIKVPSTSACRPLLTAIHTFSEGNVTMLKASIDWLIENVTLCRTILKAADSRDVKAAKASKLVNNIESWLQHNLEGHGAKGGRLPWEIELALQAVCSAVLFNKTTSINLQEVQKVLPSIGGRKRLTRMKDFNSKMITENSRFTLLDRKVRKDVMW